MWRAVVASRRVGSRVGARAAAPRAARAPLQFFSSSSPAPEPEAHHPASPTAPADPDVVSMLMSAAHWKRGADGLLTKAYEFRDGKTADRFFAQATDLLVKMQSNPNQLAIDGKVVTLIVAAISKGAAQKGFSRQPLQGEIDVALAVDDVAAELQLGGRWN